MATIHLTAGRTFGIRTVEVPAVASPKGKVVIFNGSSASTRAAVFGALESQPVDPRTQIIDSYIMGKPPSSDLIERELRSVYIEQVLKSADEGHPIVLATCLLNNSEGRRELENILSISRNKQVPLVWVDADFEPRDSRCCRPEIVYRESCFGSGAVGTILPSRTKIDLEGIELVTRMFTPAHTTQEAVQELLYLMRSTRR
ncbi:unnamed protein product [Fusarium graminearum]|nr:unnamed protein product [Fusarium graminearum]